MLEKYDYNISNNNDYGYSSPESDSHNPGGRDGGRDGDGFDFAPREEEELELLIENLNGASSRPSTSSR